MQLITIARTNAKMIGVNVSLIAYAVLIKEGTCDTSFGALRFPLISTDIH